MTSRTQRKLRPVRKLPRVAIADAAVITNLRLKLLANGYVPIQSHGRMPMWKGWNKADINRELILSWLDPRVGRTIYPSTCLRIEKDLAAVDCDVPNHELMKLVRPLIPAGALERGRSDGSAKVTFFMRLAGQPFEHTVQSRKWSMAPDDPEAPTFQIEVFGSSKTSRGDTERQCGAFGPHTISENGDVAVSYAWRGPSPADVPLRAIAATISQDQALELVAEFDRIAEAAGYRPLEGYRSGLVAWADRYDLDDLLRFEGEDFSDQTLADLTQMYWNEPGELRCSGSWTGEGGKRQDRCLVEWSGAKESGHIRIKDFATSLMHFPREVEPPKPEEVAEIIAAVNALALTGTNGNPFVPPASDETNSTNRTDGTNRSPSVPAGDEPPDEPPPPDGGGENEPEEDPERVRWQAAAQEITNDHASEDVFARVIYGYLNQGFRYDPFSRRWYKFDGVIWAEASAAAIEDAVRTFTRGYGAGLRRDASGLAARRRLGAHKFQAAVEKIMRAPFEYRDGFDRDPWTLGCPTCVVDLKTGKTRPGRSEDNISKRVRCDPAKTEDCPQWLKFIEEITLGDKELQRLLQQWFGLSLCGDPSHQKLMFCYGETGYNGKNTFIDTLIAIAQDYGYVANIKVFMSSRFESHPTAMWAFKGKRMVVASEVGEESVWDEVMIKSFTGDAMITARAMRENFETFPRTFSIAIIGNHQPKLRNPDGAMRRRLRMVPFDFRVAPDKLDSKLPGKLLGEDAGILRWGINGLLDATEHGLIEPGKVQQQTDTYFEDEDIIGRFVADEIERQSDAETPGAAIYERYRDYARGRNIPTPEVLGDRQFGKALRRVLGTGPVRRTRGMVWVGIKLRVESILGNLQGSGM